MSRQSGASIDPREKRADRPHSKSPVEGLGKSLFRPALQLGSNLFNVCQVPFLRRPGDGD